MTNELSPVLTALDGPLGALFDTLGITLGGADITILSLTSPHSAAAGELPTSPQPPALAR